MNKRKISFIFAGILFYLLFSLFAFELIYRSQIIDTFAPELKTYNNDKNLNDEKNMKSILIMGDSFTAGKNNYPYYMQNSLQDWRIINSGVSGTGIIQTLIIAPKRFKRFKPSIFIYQIYVGNDLFDITYPVNWKTNSFFRNTYWSLSNYFRSISFLNYRLGQISMKRKIKDEKEHKQTFLDTSKDFSIEKYSENEKIYKNAEPLILENQIMVKGKRKKDFDILLRKLEKLITYCKQGGECKTYILVIPHACQVSIRYLINMKRLGFILNDTKQIIKNEYPFIEQIRKKFENNSSVQIINPIQILKNYEKEKRLMYYQNDGHLNPQGQKVIADYIISKINLN